MKWTGIKSVGICLFAAIVLVFAVNGRNSFVRLDDMDYVTKNPYVENGLSPRMVKWAFRSVGYASNWHPLTWISHAADVTIAKKLGIDYAEPEKKWGVWAKMDSAFAHFLHWENVLLHALNALMLWLLMLRLATMHGESKTDVRTAVLAALFTALWAVHPLRVEVVAWISERKEILSVFLMLLTIHLYLAKFRFAGALAVFAFALALLAKPVAVSLPALLFAWEWVGCGVGFRKALDRTLPFVILAGATCYFTMGAQDYARYVGLQMTPFNSAMCVVMSPAVYLRQTIAPYGLTMDYADPTLATDWPYAVVGLILLLAMAGVCIWWLVRPNRWNRLGALAVAWCYVGLLPMIGIVRVGTEPHSDRYTYWIACGASVILFTVARWLVERWRPYERQCLKTFAVVLAVFSAITVYRSTFWKDTVRLFQDAADKTHSDDLVVFLMDEYCLTGGPEGIKKAGELIRGTPSNSPAARGGLALYLSRLSYAEEEPGQLVEARLMAQSALEDDPYCKYAHAAMGILHSREQNYAAAVESLDKAFRCGYENPELEAEIEDWRKLVKGKTENTDVQR